MDSNNTKTFMKFAALAMVLVALVVLEEPTSIPVCNIDANYLEKCRPAVTGNNPPPPRNECCKVLQAANLECICRFKSYLPIFTIDSSEVQALLSKCGVTTIPPCLSSFQELSWIQKSCPATDLKSPNYYVS